MREFLADQLGEQKGFDMARNRLTARQVQVAGDGDHSDGDGLLLRIKNGRGAWVFRFTAPDGRRREMGLGKLVRNSIAEAGKSLTAARDQADDARKLLRDGLDPIVARDRRREEARRALELRRVQARAERATLARVAREYHERVIEPSRTTKHAAQWIASLENHIPDRLWHAPIDAIEAPALLDCIADLQAKIPETASRIRQRLEAIFDDAEFRGLVSGNPARAIRRKLRETKRGRERGSFAALPYAKLPAFVRTLRRQEGIAARALEFALLTAARTGEVLGATWSEFDLDAGVWTVPAARMKGGERHVVYLTPRAVEIVRQMADIGGAYVFPSPLNPARPLSNMAMLTLLRRLRVDGETTVHGLCRATFSTWAHETGAARPDVIEACLAHREADRVRAAYNRAQFMAERKALLAAWSEYCDGKAPAANVIEFPQPRAVGA